MAAIGMDSTDHPPKQCQAFGKQCAKCNGKNHFPKQCFTKGKINQKGRSVEMIEETDLCDTFFVGMVTSENLQASENTGQLSVNAQSRGCCQK